MADGIKITNLDVGTSASANDVITYVDVANNVTLQITKENFLADSGYIQYDDISITVNTASGTGDMTYDQNTGVFNYTPPFIPSDIAQLADSGGLLNVDVADVTNLNTDNVTEGSTNLYHTVGRARASLNSSNTISYDSATGTMQTVQDIRTTANVTFYSVSVTDRLNVQGTIEGNLTGIVTGTCSDISNHDTDTLLEGSTNLYFTDQRAKDAVLTDITTSDVDEGSNLYHTTARVDAVFAGKNLEDLSNVEVEEEPSLYSSLIWDTTKQKWVPGPVGSVPIGAVSWFATTTPPGGFIECNGQGVSVDGSEPGVLVGYPALYTLLVDAGSPYGTDTNGNPRIPDLRGVAVRGWDNGRGLDVDRAFGSYQADDLKSHLHGRGTLQTSEAGGHTHTLRGNNRGTISGQLTAPGLFRDDAETNAEDANSILGVPDHNHTLTGSTASVGGSETRMKNIALLPCIKAFGTVNIAGVAEIQNLFSTIASTQEAIAGTINDKVMTPLTTKAAIDSAVDIALEGINPDPIWAGVSNLNAVKSTYQNSPVGTKISYFEDRVYRRPSNSNGGQVTINDQRRFVVKKTGTNYNDWINI